MTTPRENVTVILQKSVSGQLVEVARGTTGVDGKYRFENVPVGTYSVKIETPDGYIVDMASEETVIVDSNPANNDIMHVYDGVNSYGFAVGVDVNHATISKVDAFIMQGIVADMIVEYVSSTSLTFYLEIAAPFSSELSATVNWNLKRDDGDGTLVFRASGGTGVSLIIPVGDTQSNHVVINSGFDNGIALGISAAPIPGDIFEYAFTTQSPSLLINSDSKTLVAP